MRISSLVDIPCGNHVAWQVQYFRRLGYILVVALAVVFTTETDNCNL
jgi:hypothetical protein